MTSLNRAGPFGSGNPEPVLALPSHQLVFADEVGQAHLRLRFKSGDGAIVNGVAFRSIGQKLGNALTAHRGQPLHVAGSLATCSGCPRCAVNALPSFWPIERNATPLTIAPSPDLNRSRRCACPTS